MYEIYTLDVKNPQDYYKSVFQDNILRNLRIKQESKLKTFHDYDIQSRKNIIFRKPIFGIDLLQLLKMNLLPCNLSSKHYSYGDCQAHRNSFSNINNTIILNKYFKKNNFEDLRKQENEHKNIYNKIQEGIYEKRELQNELDRLLKLLEVKEKEIELEKEKENKMNIMINHNPIQQVRKLGLNYNNPEYKNNLILNQNKKINSSINISNLNMGLNKNKNIKLFDKDGNNILNQNFIEENNQNENFEKQNKNKEIIENSINDVSSSRKSIEQENNINLEKENPENELIDINEKMEIDQEAGEEIKNDNEETEDQIELNEETEIHNSEHKKESEEVFSNLDVENVNINSKMDVEISLVKEPDSVELNKIKSMNDVEMLKNVQVQNSEKSNNTEYPTIHHLKLINKNSNILSKNKNPNISSTNQETNLSKNQVFKVDPEKLKEVEEIKKKIEEIKKKLKPKHINKIKENFVTKNYSDSDTIQYTNTESLNEMILNPQKMMNICQDLMTKYKFHIPKFMSSCPQLIPSKISSETQQSNNRYKMLYNNLNRIPNVQKYFSLFKIISLPDKKLVEYDSGKLMKLAGLLKKLKQNKSKALIFTQVKLYLFYN